MVDQPLPQPTTNLGAPSKFSGKFSPVSALVRIGFIHHLREVATSTGGGYEAGHIISQVLSPILPIAYVRRISARCSCRDEHGLDDASLSLGAAAQPVPKLRNEPRCRALPEGLLTTTEFGRIFQSDKERNERAGESAGKMERRRLDNPPYLKLGGAGWASFISSQDRERPDTKPKGSASSAL
jgi:hypothetical protein